MIINETKTITNFDKEVSNFKINVSPVAFDILSKKLYEDPIKAIVRELLSNALDSQIKNGNPEHEIVIHSPTITDPYFEVRDFGTGMSEEKIMNLYTSFFASDKSTSNDFTGCFGLGSKTPFAYTDIFTVTSWSKSDNSQFNSKETTYLCMKKDGLPSIVKANEQEVLGNITGFSVKFSVKPDDCSLFRDKIIDYLYYMPEYNINSNITIDTIKNKLTYEHKSGNCTYKLYEGFTYHNTILVKQGLNYFSVERYISTFYHSYPSTRTFETLWRMIAHNTLIIEVPIGTFDVIPSRELLHISEEVKERIWTMITYFINYLENEITKYPDKYLELCTKLGCDSILRNIDKDRAFQLIKNKDNATYGVGSYNPHCKDIDYEYYVRVCSEYAVRNTRSTFTDYRIFPNKKNVIVLVKENTVLPNLVDILTYNGYDNIVFYNVHFHYKDTNFDRIRNIHKLIKYCKNDAIFKVENIDLFTVKQVKRMNKPKKAKKTKEEKEKIKVTGRHRRSFNYIPTFWKRGYCTDFTGLWSDLDMSNKFTVDNTRVVDPIFYKFFGVRTDDDAYSELNTILTSVKMAYIEYLDKQGIMYLIFGVNDKFTDFSGYKAIGTEEFRKFMKEDDTLFFSTNENILTLNFRDIDALLRSMLIVESQSYEKKKNHSCYKGLLKVATNSSMYRMLKYLYDFKVKYKAAKDENNIIYFDFNSSSTNQWHIEAYRFIIDQLGEDIYTQHTFKGIDIIKNYIQKFKDLNRQLLFDGSKDVFYHLVTKYYWRKPNVLFQF